MIRLYLLAALYVAGVGGGTGWLLIWAAYVLVVVIGAAWMASKK
jgi:hypothetical protein